MFIEHIFPYVSGVIFLLGLVHKLRQWLTVPAPLPITIFPVPGSLSGRLVVFLKEMLLFNSLYRHNRQLWLFSWTMHITLGLIIVGHITGIYFLGEQFSVLGITKEESRAWSYSLGMTAGVLLVISLVGLLWRRLYQPEVRATSDLPNYVEIGLLAGITLTGIFLRISLAAPDLELIREYLISLIFFHPGDMPNFPWFLWHFILLNILVMYLPYSKLVHGLGGGIIRIMLTELPPEYPTLAGKSPKSSFANPAADSWQPPSQLL